MGHREKKIIISVVSFLVVFKILLLFAIVPIFQHHNPEEYNVDIFPDGYDLIAENLIEGHGYRVNPETSETIIRTPGFVLILAGIFAIAGKSLTAVKIFNLFFYLLTGWLLYNLTFRLTGSWLTALIATVIFLLYPGTIIAESRGGFEAIYTFSIVLFILLYYKALNTLSYRDFALTGLALGFGLLIRSTIALALPALCMYSFIVHHDRAPLWRIASLYATSALIAFVILSPWIVRNYKLTGKFIPTMTVGGLAAFQGLYVVEHDSSGKQYYELLSDAAQEQAKIADSMGLSVRHGFFPQFYSAKDEVLYYNTLAEKTTEKYRNSPSLLLRVLVYNMKGFWFKGKTNRATTLNMLLNIPFLLLFIIGTYLTIQRKFCVGPIIIVIGTFIAPHLPIIAHTRHSIPLVPLLAISSALPIALVLSRWRPSLDDLNVTAL